MTVPIEDGRSAASRFRCSIASNRASFSVVMLTLPGVLPSSGGFFGCFGGGQYGPSSPSTSPFVGLSFGLKRLSIGEKILSKKPSTGFGATGLVGGIPRRWILTLADDVKNVTCLQFNLHMHAFASKLVLGTCVF